MATPISAAKECVSNVADWFNENLPLLQKDWNELGEKERLEDAALTFCNEKYAQARLYSTLREGLPNEFKIKREVSIDPSSLRPVVSSHKKPSIDLGVFTEDGPMIAIECKVRYVGFDKRFRGGTRYDQYYKFIYDIVKMLGNYKGSETNHNGKTFQDRILVILGYFEQKREEADEDKDFTNVTEMISRGSPEEVIKNLRRDTKVNRKLGAVLEFLKNQKYRERFNSTHIYLNQGWIK